jgi:hypothetical protein
MRALVFIAVLGGLFAGAVSIGKAVGPIHRGSSHDHAHLSASDSGVPPGVSLTADGLRLAFFRTSFVPGRAQELRFRVLDTKGLPVRQYDDVHARRLHLIVVRRDLRDFQHLHPVLGPHGIWRTRLLLARAGVYRAFADFSTGSRPVVLGVDLVARGASSFESLPPLTTRTRVGSGYEVTFEHGQLAASRSTAVSFAVSQAGRPVKLDPYLGAGGHLVVLREGDLAYLHTHPADNRLDFELIFPSPGRYRAFLQFSVGGHVHTAPFTLEVHP